MVLLLSVMYGSVVIGTLWFCCCRGYMAQYLSEQYESIAIQDYMILLLSMLYNYIVIRATWLYSYKDSLEKRGFSY